MTAGHIRPSHTKSTAALWLKSALNALLFFAVFLALLPWLVHKALPLSLPFCSGVSQAIGLALFVAAIVVWMWGLDVFSRQGRGTPFPLDAPRLLVTQGPYRVIRNPIMAAEMAVAWAEVLYFGSLGLLLYAALMTVLGHVIVIKVEEPELRRRMGEVYEEYCAHVPRWFPTLGDRFRTAHRPR
jgi:protein-S-isoprenylcysteine O-methyltransferase Ste14